MTQIGCKLTQHLDFLNQNDEIMKKSELQDIKVISQQFQNSKFRYY